MSEWSHLPNARHIDRVIESLKSHSDNEAWAVSRKVARNATQDAAGDRAWIAASAAASAAARAATLDDAYYAARDAAWYAALNADRRAAYYSVRGAILALIAYDDAAKYLNMTVDQLKMWAILSEDPAAILLLPTVIAYEKISELETA
jgi:hypothetical protein